MSTNSTHRVVRRYLNSNKPPRVLATGLNSSQANAMINCPVQEPQGNVPVNPPPNMVAAISSGAYDTGVLQPSIPSETYVDSMELES